jgi:hypothetical protein
MCKSFIFLVMLLVGACHTGDPGQLPDAGREDASDTTDEGGGNDIHKPVILYTDILSGPNTGGEDDLGCHLSIFGIGFPNEKGTPVRPTFCLETSMFRPLVRLMSLLNVQ